MTAKQPGFDAAFICGTIVSEGPHWKTAIANNVSEGQEHLIGRVSTNLRKTESVGECRAHGRRKAPTFTAGAASADCFSSSSSRGSLFSRATILAERFLSSAFAQLTSSSSVGTDIFQSPSVGSKDNESSFASSSVNASSLYRQQIRTLGP